MGDGIYINCGGIEQGCTECTKARTPSVAAKEQRLFISGCWFFDVEEAKVFGVWRLCSFFS